MTGLGYGSMYMLLNMVFICFLCDWKYLWWYYYKCYNHHHFCICIVLLLWYLIAVLLTSAYSLLHILLLSRKTKKMYVLILVCCRTSVIRLVVGSFTNYAAHLFYWFIHINSNIIWYLWFVKSWARRSLIINHPSLSSWISLFKLLQSS